MENRIMEKYAKNILEKNFKNEFYDLHLSECPDIYSDDLNIGIEVTEAADEKEKRTFAEFKKLCKGISKNEKWLHEQKNSSGSPIYENGVYIYKGVDDFNLVNKSVENKLEKLNKHYKIYKNNFLFVYSDILADEFMIKTELKQLMEIENKFEYKFDKIYVYVPWNIYIFNLKEQKYEIREPI